MNSVLNGLASVVSPEAMSAGTPTALKVGHINHGAALYGALVVDAEKQGITTVETIASIALDSGLTCTEFAAACKKSQEIADTTDKANGFEVAADAKGIEKYGPKRRLLNQRLSEAKQLFGVFKLAPAILKELGYWSALAKARDYLESIGKKWDNTTAPTAEEKQANQSKARTLNAVAQVMDETPQLEGESRKDYLTRIDGIIDAKVEQMEEDAFNKGVKTLYETLTKKHGDFMLTALLDYSMGQADSETLESVQAWIQEELVCRALAEKK